MTIKNPQKTRLSNFSLSIGRQINELGQIQLLGLSKKLVDDANLSWYDFDKKLTVESNVPIGSITYYNVCLFDDNPVATQRKTLIRESGWGRVNKRSDSKRPYLERLEAKQFFNIDIGERIPRKNFNFDYSQYLVIQTATVPYEHLFSLQNTVICSLGNGVPELVHLKNGELLVNINEDIRGAGISEVVSSTTDYLDLNSKDSYISSNSLRLKSQKSRPKTPEAGTIIYNNRKKCFEGFDGSDWRTLKWEE